MGVVQSGFDELLVNLRNVAERSSRGAREELRQGAKDIQELAIRQAPVDEGNLESAIVLGTERDSILGGRKVYTVYVDESISVGNGRTVGDYAESMHEGVYNPGLRSENKQAANPDIIVGRKFLESALDALDEEIRRKVEARINQGIGH